MDAERMQKGILRKTCADIPAQLDIIRGPWPGKGIIGVRRVPIRGEKERWRALRGKWRLHRPDNRIGPVLKRLARGRRQREQVYADSEAKQEKQFFPPERRNTEL